MPPFTHLPERFDMSSRDKSIGSLSQTVTADLCECSAFNQPVFLLTLRVFPYLCHEAQTLEREKRFQSTPSLPLLPNMVGNATN